MTTAYLAPAPIQNTFFIPGTNTPGTGVQLFLYVAGSTTKQTAYQDSTASTPWSNPIVLDSGGNLPSGSKEVWFVSGQTYKAVYAPSNDTDPPISPYLTLDNLPGINDITASVTVSEWQAGPTPTYVSATSFTLVGDQTGTYTKGRRIKATVTAGTVYATVTNAVFSVVTTVTVSGGSLDSGLSAISYGLLDPANPSISFYETSRQATASIASAATTNIWATDGDSVHITGTTAIASFSSAPYAGALKTIICDSTVPFTYNASTMVVPSTSGAVSMVGEILQVYADTTSKMVITGFQSAYFVSSFTYQMTTASAGFSVVAPAMGFKPRTVEFYSSGSGQIGAGSWGFADDGINQHVMYDDFANTSTNTYQTSPGAVGLLQTSVGASVTMTVTSYALNTVGLSMTKTGAPTGAATIKYRVAR